MAATQMRAPLDDATCRRLLEGEIVGRLGLAVGGHVEIFPVNFAVADDKIVFRTTEGLKALAAASSTPEVAFEVDGFDAERRSGWSVVAVGRMELVLDRVRSAQLDRLDVRPFADAVRRNQWIEITIDRISGRRVGPLEDEEN